MVFCGKTRHRKSSDLSFFVCLVGMEEEKINSALHTQGQKSVIIPEIYYNDEKTVQVCCVIRM